MAPSSTSVTVCRNIWHRVYYGFIHKNQDPTKAPKDFLDDKTYLEEQREASFRGKVNYLYDNELKTRIFYTNTARPTAEGKIPIVDPEAKALYVYLHGSGTQKAGGENFSYKANALANMGYAVLSLDLPFHKSGSTDPKLVYPKKFNEYLDRLIQKYRVRGQPVYLAGHSFGPELAAEYLRRKPHGVDGAVLISPATYTNALQDYFVKVTSMATHFWGDTKPNRVGANWGGIIASLRTWTNPPSEKSPDPTIENPNLRVRVMSGAWDEYFPGKLDENGEPTKEPRDYDPTPDFKRVMKNAEVTIEPGVGHYIFLHKDANGHDVVLRELLAVNGDSIANEKEMKKEFNSRKFSSTEQLLQKFSKEPMFRTWMIETRGGEERAQKVFANENQKEAQTLLNEYQAVQRNRLEQIYQNIRTTEQWAPEFFREHEEAIKQLGTKSFDASPLVTQYAQLLEKIPERQRNGSARAPKTVWNVPITLTNAKKEENKTDKVIQLTPEIIERQRLAKERKQKLKEERQQLKEPKQDVGT
jgi:pimeloyl-ACP methyl ester carboxylesterase